MLCNSQENRTNYSFVEHKSFEASRRLCIWSLLFEPKFLLEALSLNQFTTIDEKKLDDYKGGNIFLIISEKVSLFKYISIYNQLSDLLFQLEY